jgi:ATP-dependent DNA helicase 2 subunit 2
LIHRINHAVKTRAIHPEKPIPETPSILLRYAQPPDDLIEKVQSKIDALTEAAEVKKGASCTLGTQRLRADHDVVPPKAKGKRARDTVKPISGLDIDELLGDEKKDHIDPDNAVPEFKQALAVSQELSEIENAAKQMGVIANTFITESFGDSKYPRALECMGVLREELTNLEEPDLYNTFVRDMKKSLLSGALGGDRRDFWFKVRWSRLGLIDKKQSEVSEVTPEEADEVSK